MITFIEYKNKKYLDLQAKGNAAQYILPFAKYFCVGLGYDIGYSEDSWKLPGSIGIDLKDNKGFHANNLPNELVDFIFSSHCLEHLDDWVKTLEYWASKIKSKGILFLYLPHEDQEYWLPWNNRKHKHCLRAKDIEKCLLNFGFSNIVYSEKDLNHSFAIVAEKQ